MAVNEKSGPELVHKMTQDSCLDVSEDQIAHPPCLQTHRGLGQSLSSPPPSFASVDDATAPRHVQLMAIGGAIGIGLFVGIGVTLTRAGPIALLLGYIAYGVCFIWPLFLCVGEMTAWLPIRGSIFEMATRFVHPSLGFAMGWTYFYSSAMLVCTEYAAVATVIQYWNTDINPAVWVALAMGVCFFLNMVAVRWYGESEFVMASTKILLILGLMLLAFITMCGANPQNDAYGFRNWTDGNAFRTYHAEGATGRFLAIFVSWRYAVFTINGPDYITLSAGEIRNPRRTIPRVAKMVVWRILFFYVLGVAFLGIICPSQDPQLLGAIEESRPGAAASPWVIGIKNLGITNFLPGFINFLVMLSGWSCGNAFLFTSSRTLYSLAQDGQAPKIFLRCTKYGVPWVAVSTVTLLSCVTFLVASNSALTVFLWFVDLTTSGLIVNSTAMYVVYIGWYYAWKNQGLDRSVLMYRAPFTPWVAFSGLAIGILTILFIGFDRFQPWDVRGFITSYFGIFWATFLFIVWTIVMKTKFVNPKDADIFRGKDAVDAECIEWEEGGIVANEKARLAQFGPVRRVWERMW